MITTPATTASVADVVARMQGLLAPLPKGDGVACFTRLYLAVTEAVQGKLATAGFADPGFLAELDRRFAQLFFDACASDDRRRPAAWAPLFEARSRRGIAPIQFALAGMNAHINRDLPVALVAACEHSGIAPDDGSVQHADYLRVNGILASVEETIKAGYLSGGLHTLDRLIHPVYRLDDIVAMWNVDRARDAAWTNAQALWALRASPTLSSRYLQTLDGTVGLAGRGLLTPADTWLGRLNRLLRP